MYLRLNAKAVLMSLLLVCSGCVIHAPLARDYSGPKPLPAAIAETYAYPSEPVVYQESILEEESDFVVRQIEFPSLFDSEGAVVHMEYYDLPGDEKKPVIVLLPILAGDNSVARLFAPYFVRKGFAALIVNSQEDLTEEIEDLNPVLEKMVKEQKRAIDWIETNEELDMDRLGLFGVSMGGIKAALLAALDERVDAAVLALAGGDLPYILTHSSEKGIREQMQEIMDKENLTSTEVQTRLEKTVTCDPMQYAPYMDARNVLMVLALFDKTVPYKKQRELRQKIGGPEAYYLPTGHYSAIVYVPYIKRKAYRFFKTKFACSIER